MNNDFSDIQKRKMIDFFKIELKSIKEKRMELVVQEREYNDLITKFSNDLKLPAPNQLLIVDEPKIINGYNTGWAWHTKAKFVLEDAGHALTTRQILNKIFAYEPALNKDKDSQRSALASLSATLSVKSKEGKLFRRYQPHADSDYHTGLLEWFDGSGHIKKEFEANVV